MSSADTLWRVNNEYRKRLSQAQTFVDLLEQMIQLACGGQPDMTLEALRHVHEQVGQLIDEHRQWRHQFYYQSAESRRMVQENRAVHRALSRFSRMRSRHEPLVSDLYHVFFEVPRPDPICTRVPNGDLWLMTAHAFRDLIGFGDYVETLVPQA